MIRRLSFSHLQRLRSVRPIMFPLSRRLVLVGVVALCGRGVIVVVAGAVRCTPPAMRRFAAFRFILALMSTVGRSGGIGSAAAYGRGLRTKFRECSAFVMMGVGLSVCHMSPSRSGRPGGPYICTRFCVFRDLVSRPWGQGVMMSVGPFVWVGSRTRSALCRRGRGAMLLGGGR